MGILTNLIKYDKNGNFNYVGWVEWQHVMTGLIHCSNCLVLNQCWFNNKIKPLLPQHEKCHCKTKVISTPIPNVNSFAKCDIRKFTEYIFSEKYAWNGKMDLFNRLGFTINDAQYLQAEYEKQAVKNYCNSKYKLGKLDMQGQRININIEFTKNGRNIVFTSGWMVKPKGQITNNTPLGD